MSLLRRISPTRAAKWARPPTVVSVCSMRLAIGLIFLAPVVYLCSKACLCGCRYSGLSRGKVLRPSIGEEYELAAYVPGPALFQRLGRSLEWEGALEPHGDLPGVDQPRELRKAPGVGPRADVRRLDAALGEAIGVGGVHRGSDTSAPLYQPGEAAERLAIAHDVDDRLYSVGVVDQDGLYEILRGVIDRLHRSQLSRERFVRRARGGDHAGAAACGQLDRVGADPSSGPHDQDGFSLPEVHPSTRSMAASPGVGRA